MSIEFVIDDCGVERGCFLRFENVIEIAKGDADMSIQALDPRLVLSDSRCKLLLVMVPYLRMGLHDNARCGAVFTCKPGTLGADHVSIRIQPFSIFTEI